MAYTVDTPIYGASQYSLATIVDWMESNGARGPYEDFAAGVSDACKATGMAREVVICQSGDETAYWASKTKGFSAAIVAAAERRWLGEGNSGGIGIWGSAAPTPFMRKPTGYEMGWIHVMEMLAHTNTKIPATFDSYRAIDPHIDRVLDLVRNHPNWPKPKVWTIGMLSTPLGGGDYVWAANQQYGKQIAEKLNALAAYAKAKGDKPDVPTTDDKHQYGNVKHPPFIDRLIPDNQTAAWDYLGERDPLGVDHHSMLGTLLGTDGWFRRGAASDGITDYGIGGTADGPALDGIIFRWNDPTGKSHNVDYGSYQGAKGAKGFVSANRSGWSNGGSDGLEGDGPLFVRTFGVNGINKNLVSIERSDGGDQNAPISAKQWKSSTELTAYWFDVFEVPWEQFPFNPKYGCVTDLLHKETATKDCPFPGFYNRIDEHQERVRQILKAAQGTEGTVIPPKPDHDKLPNGWTEAALTARFGKVKRIDENGKITSHGFNMKGAISNAWIARAATEGVTKVSSIPMPQKWFVLRADSDTTQDIIVFQGKGAQAWTLYRPDAAVGWRWLDAAAMLAPRGVEYSFANAA